MSLPPSGSEYPNAHSDIQCGSCLRYFRHEADLDAHGAIHGSGDPSRVVVFDVKPHCYCMSSFDGQGDGVCAAHPNGRSEA